MTTESYVRSMIRKHEEAIEAAIEQKDYAMARFLFSEVEKLERELEVLNGE